MVHGGTDPKDLEQYATTGQNMANCDAWAADWHAKCGGKFAELAEPACPPTLTLEQHMCLTAKQVLKPLPEICPAAILKSVITLDKVELNAGFRPLFYAGRQARGQLPLELCSCDCLILSVELCTHKRRRQACISRQE